MLLLINEILLSLCCIFPFSHNSNMQFAATSVLISRFWSSELSWNCRFYSSLCCPTIFAILSTYFVVIYFKRHHAPLSDCLLDALSCCWDIYALLLSEIWIIFLFCSRRCESHLHAISTTCGAKQMQRDEWLTILANISAKTTRAIYWIRPDKENVAITCRKMYNMCVYILYWWKYWCIYRWHFHSNGQKWDCVHWRVLHGNTYLLAHGSIDSLRHCLGSPKRSVSTNSLLHLYNYWYFLWVLGCKCHIYCSKTSGLCLIKVGVELHFNGFTEMVSQLQLFSNQLPRYRSE